MVGIRVLCGFLVAGRLSRQVGRLGGKQGSWLLGRLLGRVLSGLLEPDEILR